MIVYFYACCWTHFFNGFMYEYVTIVLFILKAIHIIINIIAFIIINACISIY